jgi:hypothetical protein
MKDETITESRSYMLSRLEDMPPYVPNSMTMFGEPIDELSRIDLLKVIRFWGDQVKFERTRYAERLELEKL